MIFGAVRTEGEGPGESAAPELFSLSRTRRCAARPRLRRLRRRDRPMVAARLHLGQGQSRHDRHRGAHARPLFRAEQGRQRSRCGAPCLPVTGRTTSSSPGRSAPTVRPSREEGAASRVDIRFVPVEGGKTEDGSRPPRLLRATATAGRNTARTWRPRTAGRRSSTPTSRRLPDQPGHIAMFGGMKQ